MLRQQTESETVDNGQELLRAGMWWDPVSNPITKTETMKILNVL